MSPPVEATSLSNLTNLLANPPQYPRNPTHQVHDPLVLYIVRVPGSQDVFLTPLKPPTKASISLEAIQSSLYYFHVPTPEDEQLRKSFEEERLPSEEQHHISRKPLPANATSHQPTHDLAHAYPDAYAYYQSELHTADVGQSGGDVPHADRLRLDTQLDGQVRRKPLGARPLQQRRDLNQQPLHSATDEHTVKQSSPPHYESHSATQRQSPEDRPKIVAAGAPVITVIRRDPASGGQWNIGTITQLQSSFLGSSLQPVSIELSTPGYNRFSRHSEPPLPTPVGSDAASIKLALESATSDSPQSPVFAGHNFSRVVEYRTMAVPEPKTRAHERLTSVDILRRPGAPTSKDANVAKSVFSFYSPWQGACTFSNAIDGKTLRCRHTVTNNSYAAEGVAHSVSELRFNLGWTIRSRESATPTVPEPETLPIPKLLESKKENFRRSLQNFKHKAWDDRRRPQDSTPPDLNPYSPAHILGATQELSIHEPHVPISAVDTLSSDEEPDDEGRLSLKLGREKAGGGYRGNSAKLGKLIIEDEGLKMADLVVAANMGIWFQYWWRDSQSAYIVEHNHA